MRLSSQDVTTGTALAGKVALVLGSGSGVGAEIARVLALAGCQVHAFTHGDGEATDAAWWQRTRDELLAQHGRVDLVVLDDREPARAIPFGADFAAQHAAYVRDNLALTATPLGVFVDALDASRGRIVYVSSAHVADPPAGLGSYVAVKQAAESLVHAICRERPHIGG